MNDEYIRSTCTSSRRKPSNGGRESSQRVGVPRPSLKQWISTGKLSGGAERASERERRTREWTRDGCKSRSRQSGPRKVNVSSNTQESLSLASLVPRSLYDVPSTLTTRPRILSAARSKARLTLHQTRRSARRRYDEDVARRKPPADDPKTDFSRPLPQHEYPLRTSLMDRTA